MPAAVLQAPIEVPLPVRVVLLGFQGEGAHGIHLEASVRRAVACAGRWLRSGVAGVGGVSRLLSATPTAPSEPVGTHAAHAHASWRARLGSGTHGLVVAAARGGVQHPVRGRACGRHSAGPVRAGRRVLMAAWRAAVQGPWFTCVGDHDTLPPGCCGGGVRGVWVTRGARRREGEARRGEAGCGVPGCARRCSHGCPHTRHTCSTTCWNTCTLPRATHCLYQRQTRRLRSSLSTRTKLASSGAWSTPASCTTKTGRVMVT